jgi:hypothetical protein
MDKATAKPDLLQGHNAGGRASASACGRGRFLEWRMRLFAYWQAHGQLG